MHYNLINMKNKKMSLGLLLLGLPLLMANSPSPYPYPTDYSSFSNTEITRTYDDVKDEYTYQTTLTNTGEGYISLDYISLNSDSGSYIASYGMEENFYYADNRYLGPSQSINLSFVSEAGYNNTLIKCFAFSGSVINTAATSTNYSEITKEPYNSSSSDLYRYSFTALLNYDKDYTYTVLINYNYDGVDKIIDTYDYNTGEISFVLSSDLDVSKITINSLIFVRGRANNSGSNYSWEALAIAGVAITIIASLIGLVIFGGIVTLIVFVIVKAVKHPKDNVKK